MPPDHTDDTSRVKFNAEMMLFSTRDGDDGEHLIGVHHASHVDGDISDVPSGTYEVSVIQGNSQFGIMGVSFLSLGVPELGYVYDGQRVTFEDIEDVKRRLCPAYNPDAPDSWAFTLTPVK